MTEVQKPLDPRWNAADPYMTAVVYNLRRDAKEWFPNGHTLLTDQDLMDQYSIAYHADDINECFKEMLEEMIDVRSSEVGE